MQLQFLKNKLKILGQLYEFYKAGGAITSLLKVLLYKQQNYHFSYA
jgi:hypothetical protein